ncbi:Cytosolic sulfotransferase 6 [Bienertia sinuspersici]
MKKQPLLVLKKVAQFVGCPFSYEEEQMVWFKRLSIFDIYSLITKNDAFFRKGKIDHKNFLTDNMINHLKEIIEIKFEGSRLDVFAKTPRSKS